MDEISIRNITTMNRLITYCIKVLGWHADTDDFEEIEDISYDFDAEDLGLKEEAFAKIKSLRELQPFVDGQKWGIFSVEFDSKKFEVTALRKVLSALIPKKRNSADHVVWDLKDLLFICFWGEENNRTIGIAHFEEKEHGLPQIKMIYCAPAMEDPVHIQHFEMRLKDLTWPVDVYNTKKWHDDWSKAFTTGYRETIHDASTLTIQLADEARGIRDRILATLAVETKDGYVHQLYEKFKDTLIHDMTETQFADMYAQTVVYGLFSARCMDETQDDFSAEEAIACIPNTNPFLKSLMSECLGAQANSKLSFDELEIGNVVDLLRHTKTDVIIQDFNRQTGGGREDPVIHFYEEFLTAYDKEQKVQRGVYYTPQPVVNFIVRAVDSIIKTEFGLPDGLASTETKKIKITRNSKRRVDGFYKEVEDTAEVPAIQVLDPATGTGTFLRQTILQIYEDFREKNNGLSDDELNNAWNEYVPKHLLPRLNGFELMMAPYAVAHMKLAMVLKDTGYDFKSDERLNIYLTNTLEEPGNSDVQLTLFDDPLASESITANGVKKNNGINVVIGNPPYAGESSNKGAWILHLMESYKLEPGTNTKLREANSKFVNDDYVKFIRYAQNMLDNTGEGVLCFINPHGYIDSPTFRGVRYSMLQSYNEIYVLDLHGNSKKKEKAPDGSKDENVFDIQQGVCINLFIKRQSSKQKCKVYHADLYGTRDNKYDYLATTSFNNVPWREIPLIAPNYLFNYKKDDIEDAYRSGIATRELFQLGTLGVLTKRDSLVVAFHRDELKEKIQTFLNEKYSTPEVCKLYGIPEKDNDKWNADNVRNELRSCDLDDYIVKVHYRPFDVRYLFYHPSIIARPNVKVLQHMQNNKNYALIVCRQGGASNLDTWDCAFVVDTISDQNIFRRGGGTVLPLYLYTERFGKVEKIPNLDATIVNKMAKSIRISNSSNELTPENILFYVYAVLFSSKFRNKYQQYLNKDFPRVPYPTSKDGFLCLARLGERLVKTHTSFESFVVSNDLHRLKGEGNNIVEKSNLKNDNLYINKTQYFSSVSKEVYSLTIGGNSPLQKYLKDRKGKQLNTNDILSFKKIICAIEHTIQITKEIDEIIQ